MEDGPGEDGENYTRAGRLSDPLPRPYANEEGARYANGGAYPPDLSLITKARHNGHNYVMSLLLGYRDPPAGVHVSDLWLVWEILLHVPPTQPVYAGLDTLAALAVNCLPWVGAQAPHTATPLRAGCWLWRVRPWRCVCARLQGACKECMSPGVGDRRGNA